MQTLSPGCPVGNGAPCDAAREHRCNGAAIVSADTLVRVLFFTRPPKKTSLGPADLEPLRAALVRAVGALDDLRFVAEDATTDAPVMPLDAQRRDVVRHGAELAELLLQARAELDILTTFVRSGGARGS